MIDIPRDLPPLGHVGYIMEDIDMGVDGFRRALGVGNFRVYDYVPLRAWAYGRSLSPCRLRIGIGSVGGHVKIELIQPGEGATPQASILQEKGPGLHHVAFSSERYEEWPDRFRQLGAEISFEAEAEDEINGYRRSFYAEVAGMPGHRRGDRPEVRRERGCRGRRRHPRPVRRHREAFRADRHLGEQCRHLAEPSHRRAGRRGLGPDHERGPAGDVLLQPGGLPGHEGPARREDHQHRLPRGRAQHHRQCDRPGADRDHRADPADIPLRRLGTPRDVADAALYLASGLSDYVTGMTIDVNGGMFMR